MNPFIYDIGTKVYFGKEELCHLGEEIKKYGNNLFMIYTGKNKGIHVYTPFLFSNNA